jgi:hypothetical protein
VKRLIVLPLFLLFFLATNAQAQLSFFDGQYSELAVSARALGMGNAYIAKSNDSASVFYNPAGLGSVRGWKVHISNVFVEWNKNWMNSAAGGKAMEVASNFPSGFSIDGQRTLNDSALEVPTFTRFSVNPHFTTRYFSAGYLYAMKTRTQVRKNAAGETLFDWADRVDHGPYVAGNISLFGGIVKFGAMAMALIRKESFGSQDQATTVTLEDDDYQSGTLPLINGGAKITLPIVGLPTFAARFNNLNSATFKGPIGTVPGNIPNSIDVGFSITPKLSNIVDWHMEINYKDANGKFPELATIRRIQAGMEFGIARIIYFRTGVSDGYGSFGLGMRAKKLVVDISSYSVDLSESDLRGQEDRRFLFSISTGI